MELTSIIPDSKKANEGVMVDYYPPNGNGEKITFKLALAGNKNFQRVLGQKIRDAMKKNPAASKDPEVTSKAIAETTAEVIILDIIGLTSKGEPVKYDSKLGFAILESNPDIRTFVQNNSSDIESFTEGAKADAADLKSEDVVATPVG